jgi:hypothetical protein
MKKEEMINQMVGESVLLTTEELKKIDKETYDWILDKLQDFVNEVGNSATEEDLKEFAAGEWLVEIFFDEGGTRYYAGPTKHDIGEQPPWGEDSWKDWDEDMVAIYYKKLQQG